MSHANFDSKRRFRNRIFSQAQHDPVPSGSSGDQEAIGLCPPGHRVAPRWDAVSFL